MKPSPALWRGHVQDAVVVLVKITPRPTSTIYSSKVLSRLASFGRVHEFKVVDTAESRDSYSHTYRAVFTSAADGEKAVAASPMLIEAYQNQPTMKSLDPFNVFGWQMRKQPKGESFKCEVRLTGETEAVMQQDEQEGGRVLVTDERSGPLYKSLLEAETPMSLLDGLSAIVEKNGNAADKQEQAKPMINLGEMYRGRRQDDSFTDGPHIKKHLSGMGLRKAAPQ